MTGLAEGEFETDYLERPWEKFDITSSFGYTLRGICLPGTSPQAPSALFVHGIRWTRYGMFKYMQLFSRRGWNVAAFDLAGHGETGYCGKYGPAFGFYEKYDVVTALNALKRRFPEASIAGVVGESMGAASCLQALGLEGPTGIKELKADFVIADCAFSSADEEVLARLKEKGVPGFVGRAVAFLAGVLTRIFRGFWLSDAGSEQALLCSSIPTFFVHGGDDTYVPTWMSERMYRHKLAQGTIPTGLYIAPGARHAKSLVTDPKAWEQNVFDFIKSVSSAPV